MSPPSRRPIPATVVFKLKAVNASFMALLASPFNCVYSAAKLKQNPQIPGDRGHGLGRLPVRRARARLALDGQALRRLLPQGLALSRRLQGLLREGHGGCARAARRPVRRRVPRPEPQRARSARGQGQGPLRGARGSVGHRDAAHLQHHARSRSTTSACARPCRWPSIAMPAAPTSPRSRS